MVRLFTNGFVFLLLTGCDRPFISSSDQPLSPADSSDSTFDSDTIISTDSDTAVVDCAQTLDDLTSTVHLELVGLPITCDPQSTTTDCRVFKATLKPDSSLTGPADDPSLDDGLTMTAPVLLAVRAPKGEPVCEQRWVVMDNGGFGEGFGPSGGAAPGEVDGTSDGYGDELIEELNDGGYVTVDLIWQCKDGPNDVCASTPDWVPSDIDLNAGNAWYQNTGATGYVGVATRSWAVYDWAHTMADDHRICAQAQSSGSGRLVEVLTRYDSKGMFEGIVFQGGPVFSDIPWMCSLDNGELGPRPSWFQSQRGELVTNTVDCARTADPNVNSCATHSCTFGSASNGEALAIGDSSAFTRATDRDFPDTNIAMMIGGEDTSDAAEHMLLWLRGHSYNGQNWPAISARSLVLRQGYCQNSAGTWDPSESGFPASARDCGEWSLSNLSNVDVTQSGFDPKLATLPHKLVSEASGAAAVADLHYDMCPTR